ncbi:MAG: oligosaccharide flippase family protein [Bdellovibrionaceae bacterium]|nr:oligosaccharide flippase family protein [Pseudobdellovibrionaceae bacterium]
MSNTDQELGAMSVRPAGHLLARNVFINIIGQALPILIAFFSIPGLIRALGTEKFGVLALAWVLAGYFNLFDLGLGRAVVRTVVQKIPLRNSELFQAIWAALLISVSLGILGGGILYFSSEWLTVHFFSVDNRLHGEVLNSLKIMGIVIPFVVSSTIFRGTLEAFQKFDWINFIQVPIGALTYLLPLAMTAYTIELPWIIATLVFARILMWVLMLVMCGRCLSGYPKGFRVPRNVLRELLSFGFWISMSNLIQPFLSYLDRFLIGSMISMVAVAYYTAPMEIVLKFWILPGAVISVIFPAFSAQAESLPSLRTLYFRSTKFLVIVIAPLSFSLSVLSEEILRLWINPEYAHQSAAVLSVLALGIFANCIGFVPAAFLQAIGKPSLPAKLHVVEFPLYALFLYVGLRFNGVVGAAGAWMVRVLFDSLALHYVSLSRLKATEGLARAVLGILLFFGLAAVTMPLSLSLRIASAGAVFLLTPIVGWYWVLSLEDQKYLLNRILRFKTVGPSSGLRRGGVRKVGIAMAVYDPDPRMFVRQLRSLRAQDFRSWVCYLTVDSSVAEITKNLEVAAELSDPRFRIFENCERLGATKNFERGVSMVLAEDIDAVAFCDQDDEWYPQKLSRSVHFLESKPMGSLVHCDMRVVRFTDRGNELIAESAWRHEDRQVEEQSPAHFLIRNCVTGAASLMDVELLRSHWKIPDSFKYHDQWYALVAAARGGVYPIPASPLYDYVQHDGNAVGVVPYQGFFYRPPGTSFQELKGRAIESWRITDRMIADYMSFGFKLGLVERGWRSSTWFGGLLYIGVGLLHLRIDPSFARACAIKGCGRILDRSAVADEAYGVR